jgi:dephospho-CoA kinase
MSLSSPQPRTQPHSQPIVALVGLCGTGKSEACAYLESLGYSIIYFGGTVVGEVQRRGMAVNPENEKAVREELRATHGMAAIAHINLPKVKSLLADGKSVAIDGLYSMGELEVLRSELGAGLKLLAIHAPKVLRYERLGKRPVRAMTPEQVDARDAFEVQNLDKAGPIALADAHVVNDGERADLLVKLALAFQGL